MDVGAEEEDDLLAEREAAEKAINEEDAQLKELTSLSDEGRAPFQTVQFTRPPTYAETLQDFYSVVPPSVEDDAARNAQPVFDRVIDGVKSMLGFSSKPSQSRTEEVLSHNPIGAYLTTRLPKQALAGEAPRRERAFVRGVAGSAMAVGHGLTQYGKSLGSEGLAEYGADMAERAGGVRTSKSFAPDFPDYSHVRAERWFSDGVGYLEERLFEGAGSMTGVASFYGAGGSIGGAAFLATMGIGEVRHELESVGIRDEAIIGPYAYGAGLVVAMLDRVFPEYVKRQLTVPAKKYIARQVARKFIKGAIGGIAREGFTEALQEATEMVAAAHAVQGQREAFSTYRPYLNETTIAALMSPVGRKRLIEAGLSGAVPGAAFGGTVRAGSAAATSRQAPAPAPRSQQVAPTAVSIRVPPPAPSAPGVPRTTQAPTSPGTAPSQVAGVRAPPTPTQQTPAAPREAVAEAPSRSQRSANDVSALTERVASVTSKTELASIAEEQGIKLSARVRTGPVEAIRTEIVKAAEAKNRSAAITRATTPTPARAPETIASEPGLAPADRSAVASLPPRLQNYAQRLQVAREPATVSAVLEEIATDPAITNADVRALAQATGRRVAKRATKAATVEALRGQLRSRAERAEISQDRQLAAVSRRSVDIPQMVVDEVIQIIAPHVHLAPAGVKVGVLERVEAHESTILSDVDARAHYRQPDGSTFTLSFSRELLASNRALFWPTSGGQGWIVLNEFAALGSGGEHRVLGGLYHEVTHARRHAGAFDAPTWRRLLDRAHAVDPLSLTISEFFRRIGDPTDWRTETLREAYVGLYHGRTRFHEHMNQEAVAHMVELAYHGQIPAEDLAAIAGILEEHFGIRVGEPDAQ